MARYGTFAYSTTDSATETKYGVSFGTENSILYGLNVDWDGDGSYDQFNEASRVLAWSVDRGRDSIINPSGNGFTPYNIGRLIITLDNHDGRYDSWNTSSELYGNLMPGKKMQFRCRVCEYANKMDLQATTDSLYIYGTNADYDTARGTATGAIYTGNYVGQTYSNAFGVHSIRRSFLKFDTSYIGENINLSKVNLKITPTAVNNDADYNVLIKQHDWAENLEASADSAYDSCLASTDSYIFGNSANLIAGSVHSSSDLPTSWINKTTPTYYSLISSRDQAGDHYSVESADFDEYITFDQTNPVLHLEYQNISDYYVFTGIVTDIQLDGYRRTATMVCEDGWRWLADKQICKEPFDTSRYLTDTVAGYILRISRFTDIWDMSFTSTDTVNDYPMHWWWDGTVKSALEMVTFGTLGRSWLDTEGVFNYRQLDETTDGTVYNLTEDIVLDNIYMPNQWENKRNSVILRGSERHYHNDEMRVIASLSKPVYITARRDIILPISSTDTNSNVYSTGVLTANYYGTTDLSSTDFYVGGGIAPYSYIDSIRLDCQLEEESYYLTQYDCYTYYLSEDKKETVYGSTSKESVFILDNHWLSITDEYDGTKYYDSAHTTADRARIETIGNTLASYLGTIRPYPVIQLRGRHEIQMLFDLEDKVNLNLPTYGIHEDFRIHKISHQTIGGLQDILTTLWLYPVITPV